MAKEAYEQAKDSYKFDKSAPSTIKRRNRYLLEYTNYITGLVKQVEKTDVDEERLWGKFILSRTENIALHPVSPPDLPSEPYFPGYALRHSLHKFRLSRNRDVWSPSANVAFPQGKANIEANVRAYIRFAAKSVAPRAYASESIKFNTLLQRRQALIFWINRKCADDVSRKGKFVLSPIFAPAMRFPQVKTVPISQIPSTPSPVETGN